MAAVTICSDFGAQENEACHYFYCFPVYLPWSDGARCRDLHFWMMSFIQLLHSPLSFSWMGLFSSSSLSAIRVVSYLRLLIFLSAILIPACASSSPAFHIMFSAYKLNKQGDNIQPWRTPFPVWNQSVVPCPVLTVASWSAYRFLKRQVRWSGIPIPWRIFHIGIHVPHSYLCTYLFISIYVPISARLLKTIGNSLVVQLLGLTAFTAVTQVWSLVGEDPTSLTAKPEKQTQIHMTSNSNPTTKASLFSISFPRSEEPGPH